MKALGNKIICIKTEKKENVSNAGIILGNKPINDKEFEVISFGPMVKGIKIGNVVRVFKHSEGIALDEKHTVFTNDDVDLIL